MPKDEIEKHFSMLLPHSQDTFETPVNFIPADIKVPKTYIICEKDAAMLPELQRKFVSQIPEFRVESIDAGHNAMLSEPDKLAEVINKVIETS